MASMDVFRGKAFESLELTDTINRMPHVPTYLSRLGLFTEKSTRTTRVWIEEKDGILDLIPTAPRGAPPFELEHTRRTARDFAVPHLELADTINADEVQNIRAWGSETELQSVQSVTNERFEIMKRNLEATKEYHRVGAFKGIVLDADGTTVIYNFFTEFDITQTTVDFDLGDPTTDILAKCEEVRNAMQVALGAEGGDDIQVFALVGGTFWRKLISHADVTEAYAHYARGLPIYGNDPVVNDLRYRGFTFGDITFRQYRGTVGGVSFIAASEGHAAPVSIPGQELFREVYAPADTMEFVNSPGAPFYAWTDPDPSVQKKWVRLILQSNPFIYPRRPEALIKLTTST